MPQCQFPFFFLLFLCFRKATQEIFLELDETKAKPSIFPEASRSPKMRRRGARSQAQPRVARPTPGPRHQGVSQPLDGKNLKDGSLFHGTYCKPPPPSSRDREDPGALPGTLPEREIPAGGFLHHHGRLRSDV
jgi:hypothetical protein